MRKIKSEHFSESSGAEEILRRNGFNCTRQQVALLELLIGAKKPVSREGIAEQLKESRPDRVTVYRILERFCEKGLVHKAYVGKRGWKYELADNCSEQQCHPHFICNRCGETFCLTGAFLPLIKGLKKGFVIQRQQVRVEGLCAECS
jgi:Fur family transcriptional regulator, ferric uptake regulator